ncbi:MAG: DMT family transporter [Proteobacteria bacterium]|nr:DMT family transporter [Pseudomonadota bacterium]MBU1711123.1 DMT family transporter [Pseudomonadota bacterium]
MIWFIFALLTAFAVATRDISVKTYQELNALEVAGIELFWSIPLFALGFFFVPQPELDQTFWEVFLISLPLNAVPYLLYLYAIKVSPISLAVPFLSFTPLFMLFTGFITLDETINLWGGAGILCIVCGSYVLNLDQAKHGIFKPLTAFIHERGSWVMLIVAFLYAFAAAFGKKALLHSSPLYFSYFFFLVFNCLILAGLILSGKIRWGVILDHKKKGMWLGGLFMSQITTHYVAISLSTAVYMIAVKRSSILLTVLLSWLILKEGNIRNRGLGALLMFCGVLLITLFG